MAFVSLLIAALVAFPPAFSAIIPRATCSDGTPISNTECCVWSSLYTELVDTLFNNVCDEVASDFLRLAFHDAIGFSESLTAAGEWGGGGADGSMLTFAFPELDYAPNAGLSDPAGLIRVYADLTGVGYGDIIQFANAVGLSICPGAPQIKFWAGRPAAKAAAPNNGLVPGPNDTVDALIARYADAGFSSDEMVDSLISHSLAFQEVTDLTCPFLPFDSTPAILDAQFFVEVLLNATEYPGDPSTVGEAPAPLQGEFRLVSDQEVARDPRTACRWQSYIANPTSITANFKAVMEKISLVGQNVSALIDCSEVIPAAVDYTILPAHLPAGKTMADVDVSCEDVPFPSITTDPGPPTSVPTFPQVDDDVFASLMPLLESSLSAIRALPTGV